MQLHEQSANIQQLKDQNALLKAQKSASTSSLTAINIGIDECSNVNTNNINDNYNVINSDEYKVQIENLMLEIAKRDNEILTLVSYSLIVHLILNNS
jgi:alpha-tubulin suppressor-like RCC1 family protein